MGSHVKGGVAICYAAALACWGGALWAVRPDPLALAALLPAALHLTGQVVTLAPANGEDALAKFRSNRFAGLLVFAAMLEIGRAHVCTPVTNPHLVSRLPLENKHNPLPLPQIESR